MKPKFQLILSILLSALIIMMSACASISKSAEPTDIPPTPTSIPEPTTTAALPHVVVENPRIKDPETGYDRIHLSTEAVDAETGLGLRIFAMTYPGHARDMNWNSDQTDHLVPTEWDTEVVSEYLVNTKMELAAASCYQLLDWSLSWDDEYENWHAVASFSGDCSSALPSTVWDISVCVPGWDDTCQTGQFVEGIKLSMATNFYSPHYITLDESGHATLTLYYGEQIEGGYVHTPQGYCSERWDHPTIRPNELEYYFYPCSAD